MRPRNRTPIRAHVELSAGEAVPPAPRLRVLCGRATETIAMSSPPGASAWKRPKAACRAVPTRFPCKWHAPCWIRTSELGIKSPGRRAAACCARLKIAANAPIVQSSLHLAASNAALRRPVCTRIRTRTARRDPVPADIQAPGRRGTDLPFDAPALGTGAVRARCCCTYGGRQRSSDSATDS